MNGFAVLMPTRTRLIGCSMAIVLALSALVLASTASASPSHERYLALGDSLAFGYSQQLFNENLLTGEPPTAFENGYPNDYKTHLQEVNKKGVPLTNNGCPGETTDSMIGNGPLLAAMAPLGATGEPPCAYHYRAGLALHHEYGETKSQLESALEVIKESSAKGPHPVTVVSFNIGANDELNKILHKCEAEVKAEYAAEGKSKNYGGSTEAESLKNCEILNAPPTFFHILKNVNATLFVIRNGSKFGGVDYAGKIVVLGYYNPYGRVFCAGESFASEGNAPESCTAGPELLELSNVQQAILNFQEAKVVEPYSVCYANPEPRFNPGAGPNPPFGHPEHEPFALQTLTNMDNKTLFLGKHNGPDIHPTPLGYEELSNTMHAQCG
jgi:hypothetical protein